jgi:hypothetical protein
VPSRHRERSLERSRLQFDAIRRQLGDAVRHDRAREVDRLAAGAAEWKVSNTSQRVRVSRTPGGEAPEDEEVLRFGSCAANESSKSSKSELRAIQRSIDGWGDRATMFTSTNRVCSLPLQSLTVEIGLVFPAQHAVCLVHVASRGSC